MSRHRRQPSRALPLDFNVDGDEEAVPLPPAAAKGGATSSVDGSQKNPRADGSRGAGTGKTQEGETTTKKPPPAITGSRTPSDGTGGSKPRHDDGTRGR